jgi:hypothetical protein
MTRAAFYTTVSLIFLTTAGLPACAQQDESKALIAECSNPPPKALDSCIERARVQEETNPTPEMQSLVAQLLQLEATLDDERHEADAPPRDMGPPDRPYAGDGADDGAAPPLPDADIASDEGSSAPDMNDADQAPPDSQGAPGDMGPPDSQDAPDDMTPPDSQPPPDDRNGEYTEPPPQSDGSHPHK